MERRFSERFANGLRVYSMFVAPCEDRDEKIARVIHSISLLHTVPTSSPLINDLFNKKLTAPEFAYATVVSQFMTYFINKPSDDYVQLIEAVKRSNIIDSNTLARFTTLRAPPVPTARIVQTIRAHLPVIKELYNDFRLTANHDDQPPRFNETIASHIRKSVVNELDEQILRGEDEAGVREQVATRLRGIAQPIFEIEVHRALVQVEGDRREHLQTKEAARRAAERQDNRE